MVPLGSMLSRPTIITVSLALLIALSLPMLRAATDGSVGATSLGTTDLSFSIPTLVRLTNMSNFSFGSYTPPGDTALDHNVCVYTNNPTGAYQITASGNGTSSAFTITNGSQTIPYAVRWNDAIGTAGNAALTTAVALTAQSGADTSSQTCSGGNSANIEVTITQANLLSVPAGTYTGILTVLIEPPA